MLITLDMAPEGMIWIVFCLVTFDSPSVHLQLGQWGWHLAHWVSAAVGRWVYCCVPAELVGSLVWTD